MDEPTSTATLISIEGIRATGRHGADPGERLMDQEFVVDVAVWVEVEEDSLVSTLDYRTIAERVRETVSTTSFQLLEALAEAVASAVVGLEPALRATAVVHKPGAASSLGVADVSAEVTLDTGE
jgi:7,8-dihydroneopterin aldolase/epimerase/oxygenase